MTVHNHGPAEGRGLDCPERRTPLGLRGACLPTTVEIELLGGPLDGHLMTVTEDLIDVVALQPAEALPAWGCAGESDPIPETIDYRRLVYRARDTWNPRTRRRQYVLG